jgi:hypothetical protein
MFLCNRNKAETLRAELATSTDFCRALTENMEHLYLLAFLLTANHGLAEQCLLAPMQEHLEQLTVFKEWAAVWTKHVVIQKAALIVFPERAQNGVRELWRPEPERRRFSPIDVVTELADIERFVFVLSMIEGYSDASCGNLLHRSLGCVREAKTAALLRFSWLENIDGQDLEKQECPPGHKTLELKRNSKLLETILQLRGATERASVWADTGHSIRERGFLGSLEAGSRIAVLTSSFGDGKC